MKELISRCYIYKLLSLTLALKLEDIKRLYEVMPFLNDKLEEAYHIIFSSNLEGLRNLMGEMKEFEPLERRMVPSTIIGRTLADIAGFYKAFGLELKGELPLDHFSVEAEFMAHLLLKEAYGDLKKNEEMCEIVRDAQKKFLEDHFSRILDYFKALKSKFSNLSPLINFFENFLLEELDRWNIPKTISPKFYKEDEELSCPYF